MSLGVKDKEKEKEKSKSKRKSDRPSSSRDRPKSPASTTAAPEPEPRKLPRSTSDNPKDHGAIKSPTPSPSANPPKAGAAKPSDGQASTLRSAPKLATATAVGRSVDPLNLKKITANTPDSLVAPAGSQSILSPNSQQKISSAVQTVEFLTQSLKMDLDTFSARVSIAMEVTELTPMLRSVKAVKDELGTIKNVVQLGETAPAPNTNGDKLALVKAVLSNEFKVIRAAFDDLKPVLPHLSLNDLVATLKALRTIRSEINK